MRGAKRSMIEYKNLNASYLCSKFPELKDEINSENDYLGCNLPHSLYGNILNPLIIKLLNEDYYNKNDLLYRIFNFYEDLAEYGDEETRNLLQVTLLEYLWDDYVTYNRSIAMMGEKTKIINKEIGQYIRIPVPEK